MFRVFTVGMQPQLTDFGKLLHSAANIRASKVISEPMYEGT